MDGICHEGSELTNLPYRWDQRLFTVILRLPGIGERLNTNGGGDKMGNDYIISDNSIYSMCEATGGTYVCSTIICVHVYILCSELLPLYCKHITTTALCIVYMYCMCLCIVYYVCGGGRYPLSCLVVCVSSTSVYAKTQVDKVIVVCNTCRL